MPEITLQIQNLTKRYNGLTAVDNLTLEVRQGEIFGLLGPNGAGKTTSINMMCGLLAPDEGKVFIQGKAVHGGDVEVRTRVGVCPQIAIFWEKLTCIEQLEFIGEMYNVPRKVARLRGDELLDILGLGDKAGCSGGSTWLWDWFTIPKFWYSMNRRPVSTPRAVSWCASTSARWPARRPSS
jgi:ABC-2 type transport system ATP-binding protein